MPTSPKALVCMDCRTTFEYTAKSTVTSLAAATAPPGGRRPDRRRSRSGVAGEDDDLPSLPRHKDRPAIERMMMLGCSRKVWNICEKVR